MFVLSLFDKLWRPDLTQAEALDMMEQVRMPHFFMCLLTNCVGVGVGVGVLANAYLWMCLCICVSCACISCMPIGALACMFCLYLQALISNPACSPLVMSCMTEGCCQFL